MSKAQLPISSDQLNENLIIDCNQLITLSQLLSASAQLADALPKANHYFTLCKSRHTFLKVFCAVLLRNATNLLPPNSHPATINEISAHYPDSVCIYDAEQDLPDIPGFRITDDNSAYDNDTVSTVPLIEAEHVAAIAFTSGSTGKPSPYVKKWKTLTGTANKLRHRLIDELGQRPTIVATVPPQHLYGLEMTVLMPLHGGCTIDSSRPFYPHEIVTQLGQINTPRILVTTPIHLRSLINSDLEFPKILKIVSATAPLSTDLAEKAEALFGCVVEEIYGCTEAGASATRRTITTNCWDMLDGMRLSQDEHGIMVSGDNLNKRQVLQDDLKIISATQFEFLGRTGDMLKVGGKRASLVDLNNKLLSINGIDDAVVFLPDLSQKKSTSRPAALVVSKLSKKDIIKKIAGIVDPVFVPRPVKLVDCLPRSENGKFEHASLLKILNTTDAKYSI